LDKLVSELLKAMTKLIFGLFSFIIKLIISLFKSDPTIKHVNHKKNIVNKKRYENDLFPDTGNIKPSSDGGWVLNPKSTFPLTIYGIDESKVKDFKKLLDDYYTSGSFRNISDSILQVIATPGFYCKEIEDYVNEYKPKYIKQIDKIILSSAEFVSATEEEKEELIDEFRFDALEIIDKQPYCDFLTLFNVIGYNIDTVRRITNSYGYANLLFYLKNKKNIGKVCILKTDDGKNIDFEKLINCGLAIKNELIEINNILEKLKLKDINESLKDIIQKPFMRKEDAINFILQLNEPYNKINKIFNSKTYYKLIPLPPELSYITWDRMLEVFEYFKEISELIAHTYVMGGFATLHRAQSGNVSNILGWHISPVNDGSTCKFCEKMSKKRFPKNQYPKVPLHIGCRCAVLGKFK
jgi:hypothetical protein